MCIYVHIYATNRLSPWSGAGGNRTRPLVLFVSVSIPVALCACSYWERMAALGTGGLGTWRCSSLTSIRSDVVATPNVGHKQTRCKKSCIKSRTELVQFEQMWYYNKPHIITPPPPFFHWLRPKQLTPLSPPLLQKPKHPLPQVKIL